MTTDQEAAELRYGMSAVADIPAHWVIENPDSQLITYPEMDQRTDEWHDQRRGMVTASAIGRLISVRSKTAAECPCPACGAPALSPCLSKVKRAGEVGAPIKQAHPERVAAAASLGEDSARDIELAAGEETRGLAALLAAERIAGFTEDTYVSYDMQRGIECEPLAIDAYSEHYGVPVETCGFMVRSWGRLRLGYSPDGLVGDDGLVEVKTRRGKKQVQTVVAGEVPAENMAQVQAGLFVSGRQWLDYVSFCGGLHLWTTRVTPDPQWFAAIASAVEACENAIDAVTAAYSKGVEGMPMTERVVEEMDLTWT
jgi:hypothetical protein